MAGIQMRVSAEYYWPRQRFSDFEEEEAMIHSQPLRAPFKTRTVS